MVGKRVSTTLLKKSSPKRFKAPGDGCCEEAVNVSQLTSQPTTTSSLSNLSASLTDIQSTMQPTSPQIIEFTGLSEMEFKELGSVGIPRSPEPIYTEKDIITPAEWSDPMLEQSMIKMMDNIEKKEAEKTARMITNEKFRLINEVVFPITKSGSKLLSIGVKPLNNYVPLLKIHNPELTSAISFSIETFEDFLKEMRKILESGDEEEEKLNVPEDHVLCVLSRYVVVASKFNSLHFAHSQPSVYKGIFLSLKTIKTVVNMGEHFLNLLYSRRIQHKLYPCYDAFINNVALYVMEYRCTDLSQKLFDIIRDKYEQNATLYEIVLKLPMNVLSDVEARLSYYREHNDYNCM